MSRTAVRAQEPQEALRHLRSAVSEGSGACLKIAAQREKELEPLFEAADAKIREEMVALADQERGDETIRKQVRAALSRAGREGKHVLLRPQITGDLSGRMDNHAAAPKDHSGSILSTGIACCHEHLVLHGPHPDKLPEVLDSRHWPLGRNQNQQSTLRAKTSGQFREPEIEAD